MLWLAGAALLFWTVCGFLSASSRDNPRGIIVIGLVTLVPAFLIVVAAAMGAVGNPMFGLVLVIVVLIPAVLLLLPWLSHALGEAVEGIGRAATGVESMKLRRSYDAAEKLMFEKKFDDAEREFLAGAAIEVEDPEPLRRAGEASLAAGRVEGAVRHFRGALAKIKSEEDRASLGIRIAELEERRLGDRAGARRTLEQLLPDLWPGKWGDYVRERLEKLGPRA
ncbi:MAG TPA: hypothetical protein VFS19_06400 [Planctomycetota bacterium]|nr:hypothetical protein [Planctomycetota bacterium]